MTMLRVKHRYAVCSAGLLAVIGSQAIAADDVARGAQLFAQCAACHSVQVGKHLTGPSLAHVPNRKAGTAEGFMRYSDALKRSGIVWNDATLDMWLANPSGLVPGTSMTFAGIKDSRARQELIAYLKAVDENKAPPLQGGGGMMGMGGSRPSLKTAPPYGQVRSIKYCGDTYTIETADGKTAKVWEFNLRFKTDSSKLGPLPGRPIAIGAGMQGDRTSIVFSSPKEISETVKESCP